MYKMDQHPGNGIPISVALDQDVLKDFSATPLQAGKQRLLYISVLAVGIAICVSFIAKALVFLINIITNISFQHKLSLDPASPANNHLGAFVIIIPAIGGLIVGLMALFGSKAIRGHGIPEAMEQILTNKSKIKPSITFLKPVSSAISIGTGGPFGAEGPIIATGGALGSTIGQLLKISHYERKILLASGATSGMAAIFGSPIAGIFLAIELLLFEFSPKSIIPVTLACITGAAGHHLLFESTPVFPMPNVQVPGNEALLVYSGIGVVIGVLAALTTKIVYAVEDAFERLPIHWMWWPAIGGIVVGVIGFFAPHTLGVGYENITNILSGTMIVQSVLFLCVMKFLSWSVALGSGTSGGTLAPLLTIGAGIGALLGTAGQYFFPHVGISLPLAALVGMAAMFAGASRALLTSIIFAIETTGQSNALLPLLSACIASYFLSYLLMENTIMTEKIARRGVKTPSSYEPDVLDKIIVGEVAEEDSFVISKNNSIEEVRDWLFKRKDQQQNYYIVVDEHSAFLGVISSSNLFSMHHPAGTRISSLIKRKPHAVKDSDTLKRAVELMAQENLDVLPVVSPQNTVTGILSYRNVLSVYRHRLQEYGEAKTEISIKRRALKVLVHGKKRWNSARER